MTLCHTHPTSLAIGHWQRRASRVRGARAWRASFCTSLLPHPNFFTAPGQCQCFQPVTDFPPHPPAEIIPGRADSCAAACCICLRPSASFRRCASRAAGARGTAWPSGALSLTACIPWTRSLAVRTVRRIAPMLKLREQSCPRRTLASRSLSLSVCAHAFTSRVLCALYSDTSSTPPRALSRVTSSLSRPWHHARRHACSESPFSLPSSSCVLAFWFDATWVRCGEGRVLSPRFCVGCLASPSRI